MNNFCRTKVISSFMTFVNSNFGTLFKRFGSGCNPKPATKLWYTFQTFRFGVQPQTGDEIPCFIQISPALRSSCPTVAFSEGGLAKQGLVRFGIII
jgi:hypothetical protein